MTVGFRAPHEGRLPQSVGTLGRTSSGAAANERRYSPSVGDAGVTQTLKRKRVVRIATIVMAVVGAGLVILAVYNVTERHWTSMAGNLPTAVGMGLSLIALRLLSKQRAGQSRPS
ncbi:hypothetical protein GCM10009593_38580 [Microlunatus antarcticus]